MRNFVEYDDSSELAVAADARHKVRCNAPIMLLLTVHFDSARISPRLRGPADCALSASLLRALLDNVGGGQRR